MTTEVLSICSEKVLKKIEKVSDICFMTPVNYD